MVCLFKAPIDDMTDREQNQYFYTKKSGSLFQSLKYSLHSLHMSIDITQRNIRLGCY